MVVTLRERSASYSPSETVFSHNEKPAGLLEQTRLISLCTLLMSMVLDSAYYSYGTVDSLTTHTRERIQHVAYRRDPCCESESLTIHGWRSASSKMSGVINSLWYSFASTPSSQRPLLWSVYEGGIEPKSTIEPSARYALRDERSSKWPIYCFA